ncbi:UPF0187-domain-containing protein [Testicularia cyperi]|uniref:UPF0187-domain-containing protein n=1 Tax=Testicularia cyperi TaxID=1882483 RepID=A0A317XZN1_9BASI|nr:UPF0187-domain-containing protein [Testicularia cyperi]
MSTSPTTTFSSLASTAFSLYKQQKEIEGRKLRLSRMSFVLDGFRLSGSVLPRIAPSVVFISMYATLIALADLEFGQQWKTSNSIVGPLSVVVGLLLVFRNSTSYDRWYEGRRIWQDASSTARSLAQLIWINVDTHVDPAKHGDRLERKRKAMRLIAAYLVACKHHLRQETGTDWPDYRGILPVEWIANPYPQHRYEGGGNGSGETSAPSKANASDVESAPLLTHQPANSTFAEMHLDVPSRILAELGSYLSGVRRAGLLNDAGPAGFSLLNAQLVALSNQLAGMVRISRTSIPVMYGIHLKQCCLFYLLCLPLVLVSELSWKMVPVVTLVAITLIGLEGISSEIEDPFGDDPSDHPLDYLCSSTRLEIERLMQCVDPKIRDE